MNKTDVMVLKRGLKRMGLALLTAVTFAISVAGFCVTAIAPGYVAVILFLASVLAMATAIVLLYAQGLSPKARLESQGDGK